MLPGIKFPSHRDERRVLAAPAAAATINSMPALELPSGGHLPTPRAV